MLIISGQRTWFYRGNTQKGSWVYPEKTSTEYVSVQKRSSPTGEKWLPTTHTIPSLHRLPHAVILVSIALCCKTVTQWPSFCYSSYHSLLLKSFNFFLNFDNNLELWFENVKGINICYHHYTFILWLIII